MLSHSDLNSQLADLVAAPHWYVAFSGGVDSTVLLHLLHHWRAAHPSSPPLTALHVNHGMQSGAAQWQRHCAGLCDALEVPLITRAVSVRSFGSREAAAREARYRAFDTVLQSGAVLFLGHNLDDQVETFFLRLLRGAGVEGLAAMPRSRSLGEGLLVRPLLDHARSQIEQYAVHHGLDYVQDPSNSDTRVDRNFLRAQVLPPLASRWPAYRQSVARASAHMAAAASTLADQLGIPATVYSVMGDPGLLQSQLLTRPETVAASRLRAWLRAGGYQAPDRAALGEFLRQLRLSAADARPQLACGSYRLQRYRDAIYRLPDRVVPPPAQPLDLAPGAHRDVPGVGTVGLQSAVGDGLWLAPGEQLTLGWRQGGERCRIRGRVGSHSLKNLLQEWHVPPWWRDRVPLLYLGGELLAVGDLAQCESSRWRAAAQEGEDLWNLTWERPISRSSD